MKAFLGLDIGTTSTIGILIDDRGNTLAIAARPATLYSDGPGQAEEDPRQWWANTSEIIRELMTKSGLEARDLGGIGVTGMLPAVILLDENLQPIRRSIQQNDARATVELREFAACMPESEFLPLTGTGYSQQLVGPKLMWLARHEPESFARARAVAGASDFITAQLTGTLHAEHNWALESGFVDLAAGAYDERLVAMAGDVRKLLPPIARSHDVVGKLTPHAAHVLGLAEGIPVVAGCADHVASAFVCGASADGDLVVKFGGAADILLSSAKPVRDRRLFLDHHIVPGLYFPNGCMAGGGNILNWIVGNFARKEAEEAAAQGLMPHQLLDRLAAERETELLFLPYILGEKTPLMDPHARGTLVGLGLHHGIGDIWRAALEGIAFGMRHHVETFEDCGLAVTNVRAADGGAASDLWLQITADVLNRSVRRIDRHPGSCLGAAFVAAMGVGAIASWDRITDYVGQGRIFEPRPDATARYARKYQLWRESYARLKTLYPQL